VCGVYWAHPAREPTGRTGTLTYFANDVPFMYWNNHGALKLTVTRLA